MTPMHATLFQACLAYQQTLDFRSCVGDRSHAWPNLRAQCRHMPKRGQIRLLNLNISHLMHKRGKLEICCQTKRLGTTA